MMDRELAERLVSRGYDLDALDRDNPYVLSRWRVLQLISARESRSLVAVGSCLHRRVAAVAGGVSRVSCANCPAIGVVGAPACEGSFCHIFQGSSDDC